MYILKDNVHLCSISYIKTETTNFGEHTHTVINNNWSEYLDILYKCLTRIL